MPSPQVGTTGRKQPTIDGQRSLRCNFLRAAANRMVRDSRSNNGISLNLQSSDDIRQFVSFEIGGVSVANELQSDQQLLVPGGTADLGRTVDRDSRTGGTADQGQRL